MLGLIGLNSNNILVLFRSLCDRSVNQSLTLCFCACVSSVQSFPKQWWIILKHCYILRGIYTTHIDCHLGSVQDYIVGSIIRVFEVNMNPRVYYVVYTVVNVAEESLNDHCGSGKNHVWLLWALHMIGCPQQPIMCGCCGS